MFDEMQITMAELEAGFSEIRRSPANGGELAMIVRRPRAEAREVLDEGVLDPAEGLVGDSWRARSGGRAPGEPLNPDTQLTLINARLLALVAQEKARWPLAGDQLVLDLDLSAENLPVGTRLAIGSAVIEVTAKPHTGCKKFEARFGLEALKFISTPVGKQLRLRGMYAKVVQPGAIRVGDVARKLPAEAG
jgi:hypothetical protein